MPTCQALQVGLCQQGRQLAVLPLQPPPPGLLPLQLRLAPLEQLGQGRPLLPGAAPGSGDPGGMGKCGEA